MREKPKLTETSRTSLQSTVRPIRSHPTQQVLIFYVCFIMIQDWDVRLLVAWRIPSGYSPVLENVLELDFVDELVGLRSRTFGLLALEFLLQSGEDLAR